MISTYTLRLLGLAKSRYHVRKANFKLLNTFRLMNARFYCEVKKEPLQKGTGNDKKKIKSDAENLLLVSLLCPIISKHINSAF